MLKRVVINTNTTTNNNNVQCSDLFFAIHLQHIDEITTTMHFIFHNCASTSFSAMTSIRKRQFFAYA